MGEPNGMTPLPGGGGKNFWNGGKVKYYIIGGGVVFALVACGLYMQKAAAEKPVKSGAAVKIDQTKEAAGKKFEDQIAKSGANGVDSKSPDIPLGDDAAKRKLAEYQQKIEAEDAAKKEAEDRAIQKAEFLQYQRKLQFLPHNEPLALAWESRMKKAAQAGSRQGAPAELSPENIKFLEKQNPKLLAAARNPTAVQAGNNVPTELGASFGNAGKDGTSSAKSPTDQQPIAGVPSKNPAGTTSGTITVNGATIPADIDPKTGLPVGSNANDYSALLSDGTPDIDNGAIPVTIQYVPPGASQAVTVIKWVKPGYLTGRVRPYDPRGVEEEDRLFRSSLKADTEVAPVATYKDSRIPWRMSPSVKRVPANNDFKHTNRYIAIVPNEQGGDAPQGGK